MAIGDLVIPPGFAQVLHSFALAGQPRKAAITYGIDATAWGGDVTLMAANLQALFRSKWQASFHTTVTFAGCLVRLGTDGGDPLTSFSPDTINGTGGAAMLPANCAALITKNTAQGGRKHRGRCYFPWVVNETVTDLLGIMTTPTVTTLQTAATSWLTTLAAGHPPENVASPMYILHTIPKEGPTPSPTRVTTLRVESLIGTQRRRLGR